MQTSFLLLHLPTVTRALRSLGQKAGLKISVLGIVSDWSGDGPMTQPGPSKQFSYWTWQEQKPFLSEHRSWSCLWQWEAGPSKEVAHAVRRNEASKERILTGFWNSVSESTLRSVCCPALLVMRPHKSPFFPDFSNSLLTAYLLLFLSAFGLIFRALRMILRKPRSDDGIHFYWVFFLLIITFRISFQSGR